MLKAKTTTIGKQAEKVALHYLTQQGLTLESQNFHSRWGEIDLIMRDHNATLIFVEVRSRKKSRYGNAASSVNITKQQKLIKTALVYLQKFKSPPNTRFDVIAIDHHTGDDLNAHIQWIQNAFESQS